MDYLADHLAAYLAHLADTPAETVQVSTAVLMMAAQRLADLEAAQAAAAQERKERR